MDLIDSENAGLIILALIYGIIISGLSAIVLGAISWYNDLKIKKGKPISFNKKTLFFIHYAGYTLIFIAAGLMYLLHQLVYEP